MQVSRAFLKDFAYLANFYGWDAARIEEVKAEIRADPRRVAYWSRQAAQHRNGEAVTSATGEGMRPFCMACDRFSLKRAPVDEARKGYGRCLSQVVDVLMHVTRDVRCRMFSAAPRDQVESRRTWWMQHSAK